MSLLILNRMKNPQVFNPDWLGDAGDDLILITTADAEIDDSRFAIVERVSNYEKSGEVESIASEILKDHPIRAIISTSESDVLRAARLRQFANLSGLKPRTAEAFRDKVVMKSYIMAAGLHVPSSRRLEQPMDLVEFVASFGLPCVVKPVDGAASVETEVFRSKTEIFEYLKRDWRRGFEVETFAIGDLYHIDGFIHEDEMVVCWPSKYRTDCLSFQSGGYSGSFMLEPEHPLRNTLQDYAEQILKALPGSKTFSFHLEVFVDREGRMTFLEIAARTGGGRINSTFEKAFGMNLNQCLVRSQAGLPLDLSCLVHNPKALYGWALIPPRDAFKNQRLSAKIFDFEFLHINKSALGRASAEGSVDCVATIEVRASSLSEGLADLDIAVRDVSAHLSL